MEYEHTDDTIIVCAMYPVRGSDGAGFVVTGTVPLSRWRRWGGTITVTVDSSYFVGVPDAPDRLPLPGDHIRLVTATVHRVYGGQDGGA